MVSACLPPPPARYSYLAAGAAAADAVGLFQAFTSALDERVPMGAGGNPIL